MILCGVCVRVMEKIMFDWGWWGKMIAKKVIHEIEWVHKEHDGGNENELVSGERAKQKSDSTHDEIVDFCYL